jgi:serine O-acetyltransferase
MPQNIQSKADYNFFLEADRIALGDTLGYRRKPKLVGDDIWKFLRLLRKAEYFYNCRKDTFSKLYFQFLRYQLYRLGLKLKFYIPLNVCGPGFSIAQHTGPIVINQDATVGANCRISMGVLIGRSPKDGAPKIGNHVFMGPNAVIVGPIEIADGIAIGANSYVSKSFLEPAITVAGAPARKVLDRGTSHIMVEATELVGKNRNKLPSISREDWGYKRRYPD